MAKAQTKVKGKEIEQLLKQDIQVILQISEQTASLCCERKMLLSLLALYLYMFSKAGKTDSDLTCCLQTLLLWHEEENVASEYFMAGMKANSIFRYADNTIEIIFS